MLFFSRLMGNIQQQQPVDDVTRVEGEIVSTLSGLRSTDKEKIVADLFDDRRGARQLLSATDRVALRGILADSDVAARLEFRVKLRLGLEPQEDLCDIELESGAPKGP